MVRVIRFSQRWRSNSLYCPTGDIIIYRYCWDHGVILHIEVVETMSSTTMGNRCFGVHV